MRRILLRLATILFSGFIIHTTSENGISAPVPSGMVQVWVKAEKDHVGPLYIVTQGHEQKIAEEAIAAWIIHDGAAIVYSAPDGAGGYENEGQSLYLYKVRTRTHRKIMADYFTIDHVTEIKTKSRKRTLLVEMHDSGLGASHVAVVDPLRGEVFVQSKVRLLTQSDDHIVLGFYRDEDWEVMGTANRKIQPYKTARYNLNLLLKRRVIIRKPSP